jgi:molecular chaperone GrpE
MNNDKDSAEEKPKINVVDRRHWTKESEEVEAADTADLEERYPDYVVKLKKESEEKDKRLREYITAYKEQSSENDEIRKRLQKENETRLDQFKANLFSRIVPILDNLQRAHVTSHTNRDFDILEKGIAMVIKQFTRELEDNDVTVIPTVGRKFDPKTDEAFMTEVTDDPEKDNIILQELEPGYMFKDRMIKPAKVKVAKLKD